MRWHLMDGSTRVRLRRVLIALTAACLAVPAVSAEPDPPVPPLRPAAVTAPEGIPKVLSAADARRYREMFELGREGAWDEVDALLAEVDNRILAGHVMAQRYLHPTAYRTPFRELRTWLKRHRDHPQSHRMYELAQARRPGGGAPVPAPDYTRSGVGDLPGGLNEGPSMSFDAPEIGYSRGEARYAVRRVRRNVRRTYLSVTEDYLTRGEVRSALRPDEHAWAWAKVAAGWYYYGDDQAALRVARQGLRHADAPYARWIAGLAAWRRGQLDTAAEHFTALAQNADAPGGKRAAGAYWAARASIRLRQPAEMSRWLRRASERGHSFYGQLAAEALGVDAVTSARPVEKVERAFTQVREHAGGRRALALFQVGRRTMAKRELIGLPGWDDPRAAASIMFTAARGGLSAFAHDMARHMGTTPAARWARRAVMAARYPEPRWRPENGFRTDRALLYAMMRKESGFQPIARSGAGARGLMQLMPGTARFVARRSGGVTYTPRKVQTPEWNLDVAQRYVRHLAGTRAVGGGLVELLTAYNAGPGNLMTWRREVDHGGDPLLFLESLPSREARHYVETVLRNLWLYRTRLDQPAPARASLAAGRRPSLTTEPDGEREVAQK